MSELINKKLNLVLEGLKDFQQATVNRVVDNYQSPDHSHRVLVADEVGLGKTIVAKGVIARLLQSHLALHTGTSFRVIYICSNLALADENRQKLALFKGCDAERWVKQPTFGRLVELAAINKETSNNNNKNIIEVCTLTPSTSFTLTAGAGNCHERAILAVLLSKVCGFSQHEDTIIALFKTNKITKEHRWEDKIYLIKNGFELNNKVITGLEKRLAEPYDFDILKEKFESLQDFGNFLIRHWIRDKGETTETSKFFNLFRTEIRKVVAQCCASTLQADLFILDEFQRFQSLTDDSADTEESLIARQVFQSDNINIIQKTKVLLLSATPFKAMTTLHDEDNETSHHQQLHKLLIFLTKNDIDFITGYEDKRKNLHLDMLALSSGSVDLNNIKDTNAREVESMLQKYICRTERSQISKGFDELVSSIELCCGPEFGINEVKGYRAIEALNVALPKGRGGVQLIELAKSAPWCMSFLQGYAFKNILLNNLHIDSIRKLLRKTKDSEQKYAWLSRGAIQNYSLNVEQDAPNAKIKTLSKIIFEQKPENLLWIPPCKPYYGFKGVFKNSEHFSKTLLFSSWALVPRALSCLWSYESERRVFIGKGKKPEYYSDGSSSPLLRFEGKSTLNVWHLLYPCKSESKIIFDSHGFDDLLEKQTQHFTQKLTLLLDFESDTKTSNDWYLLAPILLDFIAGEHEHIQNWLNISVDRAENEGRAKHLKKIERFITNIPSLKLGRMPSDLARVLAYSSIANPALCSMRTIHKLWGNDNDDRTVLSHSIQFAELTSKLFNHEYSVPILNRNIKESLLAGPNNSPGWYKVLVYCAHGNFQSMLDEYCHLLSTSGCNLSVATDKLHKAMGIRSSTENVHFWEDSTKAKRERSSSLRCHFAVPLGNQKLTEDSGLSRIVSVRDAFNSPFRPFVLTSTSIGQEGLDFHWYCRRVVHWNLPNNPIDIEQREGRVNRYKSFVVRKRIAETYSVDFNDNTDIWFKLFEKATQQNELRYSDLEPFWLTRKGTTQIERIVPTYPMSKEVARYSDIKKILVLYRLAFGQPRQQELLESFSNCNTESEIFKRIKDSLIIHLAPMKMLFD